MWVNFLLSFPSLQLLSRLTERFVQGVDMFVETLWKVWMELLEVLGLDGGCGHSHAGCCIVVCFVLGCGPTVQ